MKINKSSVLNYSLLTLSILILNACNPNTIPPTPTSGIPSDLQEQLDKTANSNTLTAQNALTQSKILYGELVGKWNTVNPIDVNAFNDTKEKLIPPMFIIANSLSANTENTNDKASITSDFKQIYFDSLTNMLRGINNNLQLYQNFLETSQIINATDTNNSSNDLTNEALGDLTGIFQATESTEFFVTQLGQFTSISPSDETQKILNGLRNQQTTIINGIINFTAQGKITPEQAKSSYQTIIKSLTTPSILTILQKFAVAVFGKDNVAFKQDEITSVQPNPNLVVMVIREDSSTYRLINIENGRIVNRISNDTRGLSAADLLNQSNVNVITFPSK